MEGFHVLMYHDIIKRESFDYNKPSYINVNQKYEDILPKPLFVFLEEFEKQMRYLFDNGYTTLRLKDIIDFYYNHKPLPEKAVLLTFDDMYKSVALYAYPILKSYGFSAVGFVVLNWMFNEEKEYISSQSVCMSKGELIKMKDVFEFANHSTSMHTRKEGKTTLQLTNKQDFTEDINTCESFVGTKGVYAYPFGVYTEEAIEWLKELRFKLAFTTESGKNDINTEAFKLRRNGIFLDYDLDKFKSILEN